MYIYWFSSESGYRRRRRRRRQRWTPRYGEKFGRRWSLAVFPFLQGNNRQLFNGATC